MYLRISRIRSAATAARLLVIAYPELRPLPRFLHWATERFHRFRGALQVGPTKAHWLHFNTTT
jgi:hypothetical protein